MDALVCVELETGKFKGVGLGLGRANSQGMSPFGMGGRIFVFGKTMFDAKPGPDGKLRRLGMLEPGAMRCTFPTGADGLLYLRPDDLSCLVQCWDLRAGG